MCSASREFYINTSIEDTVNVRMRTLIYLKTVQNWWAQVSRILLRYVLYMILYATECDLTAFVCNVFSSSNFVIETDILCLVQFTYNEWMMTHSVILAQVLSTYA